MNYQWYPGHMMKAKRMMQENIKLVDLVIELLDARIPISSRNPDIDELGRNKSRLILLNKSDLADARFNKEWIEFFKEKGYSVLEVNSKTGSGIKAIQPAVREACREKIERNKQRGIINRPLRALVAGIPNVGKSTFINSYAGKACTKTGNKPGVTKGKQWIRLSKELELLDTPGILWPKFENQDVGRKLAFIGSMNDEIIQMTELAIDLLAYLVVHYRKALIERYQISEDLNVPLELLEDICNSRKCVKKGGEIDYEKGAALLLDDFRSGRIGRITLETPADFGGNILQ
ncbi:MAG: ribosome biogenesis GTPase YlqF [Clostridiales bacterium]|nr:ribosome biogenesis GTPase YlqF [Clostridiales bacterium]